MTSECTVDGECSLKSIRLHLLTRQLLSIIVYVVEVVLQGQPNFELGARRHVLGISRRARWPKPSLRPGSSGLQIQHQTSPDEPARQGSIRRRLCCSEVDCPLCRESRTILESADNTPSDIIN